MRAAMSTGLRTVTLRINISSVTGCNQKPREDSYTYKATFDPSKFTVVRCEDAPYTLTNYVVGGTDAIYSDIFSLMPSEALEATPYQIIAGRQNDYKDGFIKNIAFSDNRSFEIGKVLNQTVTEVFFERSEASRGGTGDAAQAMTLADVDDVLQVGRSAHFFIFHRVYDEAQTRTNYEGTATILSISSAA
jgi:hypothetical protein